MKNSYYVLWSIEEIRQFKELALTNKFSYKDIGKQLNRSASSCQSKASELGIRNRYNEIVGKKYTVNENFWVVPNEVNSYWAGFSAADANIEKKSDNAFSYRLEIQLTDKEHLQRLKEDINFTGPIKDIYRTTGKTSKIQVNSTKWANDLKNNFGIIPKKTHTIMPPDLDDNLLLRWLVGYTDGDGCISIQKKSVPYIIYSSCNQKLIEYIKNYFDNFGNQLKYKPSKIMNDNNKYFKISIGGLKAAQFIDKVNKLNCYKLARKWSNPEILEVISAYKLKFPHLFIEK